MKPRPHLEEDICRTAAKFRRRGEVRRILFWSGFSNLVLMSVFMGVMLLAFNGGADSTIQPSATLTEPRRSDPLAMSRPWRSDFEAKASGGSFSDHRKGPLALTRILAEPATESAADPQVKTELEIADADAAGPPPFTEPAPVEETRGLRVAPLLRKNQQSGKLEIGSFTSLTFAGGAEECLEFGHSMLEFANSSPDLLDIQIATDEISVARICAANGSIVITCRSEQITISPRRVRADDQCGQRT